MTANKIGGNLSKTRYFRLFLFGVIFGSLIRIVAFIAPIGVVRRLEALLLPDETVVSDEPFTE